MWEVDKGGIWRQVFRRGEGTPLYAWVFKWGCRAASPLAAVAACGSGKCPGGMNPSPTDEPLAAV